MNTRIAPSPTGNDLHIGNLYTALINYVAAKQSGGSFIVRIEDTDQTRRVEGSMERILATLANYGLVADESPIVEGPNGPYIQSHRLPIYHAAADNLIAGDKAYRCYCTREQLDAIKAASPNDRHSMHCLDDPYNAFKPLSDVPHVVRLRVPENVDITFTDSIRGEITINSNQVDDQILIKSDGFPTYHMAVVVDDNAMGITNVIRAEEWISSTPKHVLLYNAMGYELPTFTHVPILRNPDRSKLSKRKNPVWAMWYLNEGFLPEAVLNYLATLAWTHPQGNEIFSLDEFIALFDIKDLRTGGPIFDIAKLTWFNQQYIQNMDDTELVDRIYHFHADREVMRDQIEDFLPLLKTRMETLNDFWTLAGWLFSFEKAILTDDTERSVADGLVEGFEGLIDWTSDGILDVLRHTLKTHNVRMPVAYRVLTGNDRGLPLPDALEIFGRENTLDRLADLN